MASSTDDLDELCTTDELTETFLKAANHLQTLVPKLDNETLLLLYGFYKQGLEGPCKTPKPSWYDMKGKAKWEAWNKLGDMSQIEAKTSYISHIKKIDPAFEGDSGNFKEGWVSVSTLQRDTELNESEKTVVDYVKEGNVKKVQELVGDLEINMVDAEGMGLIHWAADSGSAEMIKFLVSVGADVDLQDGDGQTALHYASSCGHMDCVRLLLKEKCDRFIKDHEGSSALDVANDSDIKNLLK